LPRPASAKADGRYREAVKRLRPFWLALGFLTTLPVPDLAEVDSAEMRGASAYYPLVGWVIGAILALAWMFINRLSAGLGAALLLAAWLALTGMLHLDGLLDSADALLASRSPQERLRILGDVHHGSFAFGAGAVFLITKWQLLASLHSPWPLLFAPVAARFWVLPVLNAFPAARPEGLGATARQGRWPLAALFSLPVLLLAPLAFAFSGAAVFLLALWASRRLGGGLSGDVYGALIELAEAIFILITILNMTV